MTTEVGKEIIVSLDGKRIFRLPEELGNIAAAIEKSRYILQLEKNFDGSESEAYSPETWLKTVSFVAEYANWLFDLFGKTMAVPKIYHGPDSSIDIYWENERFNLLINIPPGTAPATFYGDNYGTQITEGRFDPANFREALLPDLSTIS